MRILGWKDFHWDEDGDLIFQERAVASLVKHESYPDMYHIKFEWREDKTSEFFNLTWARDNARSICLKRYQETL